MQHAACTQSAPTWIGPSALPGGLWLWESSRTWRKYLTERSSLLLLFVAVICCNCLLMLSFVVLFFSSILLLKCKYRPCVQGLYAKVRSVLIHVHIHLLYYLCCQRLMHQCFPQGPLESPAVLPWQDRHHITGSAQQSDTICAILSDDETCIWCPACPVSCVLHPVYSVMCPLSWV